MIRVMILIVTIIGLMGCTTFVTAYVLLTNGAWRDTEVGKFLLAAYANLALLFLLIIVNQVFGQWPGRQIVVLSIYVLYAIQSWWPVRLLFQAQRRKEDVNG